MYKQFQETRRYMYTANLSIEIRPILSNLMIPELVIQSAGVYMNNYSYIKRSLTIMSSSLLCPIKLINSVVLGSILVFLAR